MAEKKKQTLVKFNFFGEDDESEQLIVSFFVIIFAEISKEKWYEIEDCVTSYLDNVERESNEQLINDVLKSFDYEYVIVEPNFELDI